MFAAGLLLGFSLFVKEVTGIMRVDISNAFNSACAVLQRFSRLSPQAGHYYEILLHFNEAIIKYHQQLEVDRRRFTGKYVSQIFTIFDQQEGNHQQAYQGIVSGQEVGLINISGRDLDVLAQACIDVVDVGDNIWDDFSPSYQPTGMF
jgi:hypothetical protein